MSEEIITNIEDEKGQRDLGVFCLRVYRGAIEEGATPLEALAIVSAFVEGTVRSTREA